MTPLAEITDYDGLIAALRARADQLEVSCETINGTAGLPDGYCAKILGLGKTRRIGMQSLGALLEALGLKLIAVEDDGALARHRSRHVKRNASQVRVHRLTV